jgi:hypothetical protein
VTTCGISRLLVPAFLVGFAVASVTGTDVDGWLAAGVTVATLVVTRTARRGGDTCAVRPGASTGARRIDHPSDLPAP